MHCFPHSRRLGRYYMRYLDKNKTNQIDVISGAFCMVRRSALDKTGLLDEDFFMYGEDIDLSYRLLQCGYKNYYQPLRILNYKGESTHKSSFRYVHVFIRPCLSFLTNIPSFESLVGTLLIQMAVVVRGVGTDLCMHQKERSIGWIGRDETARLTNHICFWDVRKP